MGGPGRGRWWSRSCGAAVAAVLVVLAGGCRSPVGATAAQKRLSVLSMHDRALVELYKAHPEAQAQVEASPGYGVFTNLKSSVVFTTSGQGYGVVHDNRTGEVVYMRMGTWGLGLGLGVKDFLAVFVFHDETMLADFVEKGWEFGMSANASAKAGNRGGDASGAATFSNRMSVYHITEGGILLQFSIAGTKYWRDEELNRREEPTLAGDAAPAPVGSDTPSISTDEKRPADGPS